MIGLEPDGLGTPFSVHSEHGMLHGQLALLPDAPGIVVLVHDTRALDERDNSMAAFFRHAGLSTLGVDLLAASEERFTDIHNNVSLLSKRLLAFLTQLKNRMMMGELRPQPFGLFAANTTSPVAIRLASLRDHDIAAIVCRGGLIDLAGVLYLRALESPLLMLAEETDPQHIASSRRALQEVRCPKALKTIPEIGIDYAASEGFNVWAHESVQWFLKHFPTTPRQ